MVDFNVSERDMRLIKKIVRRACPDDRLSLTMDLSAAKCSMPEIDLKILFEFEDFDFFHDVYGISAHINRTTGKIGDCFLPRCAR